MKKKCDVYYIRNFFSLIHSLSITKQFNNSNYKILYLNYASIDKKTYWFFKNFFDLYFDEIRTFSFFSNESLNKNFFKIEKINIYERIFLKTNSIKRFSKKINLNFEKFNVENVFSGGHDFHLLFKKSKKIYYIEHGIGNYRDGLIFKKKKIIFFLNYFFKFFNFIGLNFFYLKKYDAYLSLLSNNIKLNPVMNNYNINYINSQKKYFLSALHDMSNYIKKKNVSKFFLIKKKKVFLNITGLKFINKIETNKVVKKIISQVNKKEIVILKDHPSQVIEDNRLKKILVKELKEKKIQFLEIKNGFLKKLPIELLIYLMGSNKLISSWSSASFFCSILFDDKKFKNIMFLEYSIKYPENLEAEINIKIYNMIKKKFKNIIYL